MAWTPAEGAALHVPSGPALHLFVVLNDPKVMPNYGQVPQVGLANFSSIPQNNLPYDKTCCFQAGTHPFLQRDSYVFYAGLRLYSVTELVKLVGQGYFQPHPVGFSKADVAKIKAGIDFSARTKNAFKNLGL